MWLFPQELGLRITGREVVAPHPEYSWVLVDRLPIANNFKAAQSMDILAQRRANYEGRGGGKSQAPVAGQGGVIIVPQRALFRCELSSSKNRICRDDPPLNKRFFLCSDCCRQRLDGTPGNGPKRRRRRPQGGQVRLLLNFWPMEDGERTQSRAVGSRGSNWMPKSPSPLLKTLPRCGRGIDIPAAAVRRRAARGRAETMRVMREASSQMAGATIMDAT